MPIWNPEIETMPRSEMKELQLEKLKKNVRYVYENVKFYHDKLDELKIKPEDIKTLEDIRKLPMTTKDDLRDHYPYGMFAVPMKDIVRIHSSSGTTGRPTVVGYTRNDLEMWAEVVARFASAAGVTDNDVAQISFGYGLFTGGFGLHYGLENIGVTVIPISGGNTARQIKIMREFEPTVLICTPSYALYMIDYIKENGIDPKKDLHLKVGLFGAEPWTDSIRAEIEEGLNIVATDNYGLSEIIGPGVSGECELKQGMHISEDHFLVEIIDPETGEWVEDGQIGEVVITPLDKEALPLLRYRTKDLSYLMTEKCACGRTTARMKKIRGRTDDMLIVRGVNVFPSQIEEVLMSMDGVAPHYQLIVDRHNNLDTLEVWVEATEALFRDEMKQMVKIEKEICDRIYTMLGIRVKLLLKEPKTIERSQGKAKRVVDRRDVYGE